LHHEITVRFDMRPGFFKQGSVTDPRREGYNLNRLQELALRLFLLGHPRLLRRGVPPEEGHLPPVAIRHGCVHHADDKGGREVAGGGG